jgi:hypothetical protein
MKNPRQRYYVGLAKTTFNDTTFQLFRSPYIPTEESHGELYGAVIGPFRTKRGAKFMEIYGKNNPHCNTVYQAEKLAKSLLNFPLTFPLTSH